MRDAVIVLSDAIATNHSSHHMDTGAAVCTVTHTPVHSPHAPPTFLLHVTGCGSRRRLWRAHSRPAMACSLADTAGRRLLSPAIHLFPFQRKPSIAGHPPRAAASPRPV